ncbi:hypothetical protein chiPu_0018542 [Chiloscyllium punctatum]|uniref:Uncharacterized protein n=2 Tax=Chiloscyllium punctatum TaxID=137246 RepID=A0A401RNR1_CHIPU|nr:hypothetical protein [Chiloscyllium punctatum]
MTRTTPASPSTHSIAASTDRTRFPRGTSSRSTFHGGQLRDRRGAAQNSSSPTSPTLSPDATPLPQTRSRASSNLFSKLTSKLTRRVTIDPSKRQGANKSVPGNLLPQGPKTVRSQTNLRETGDLRSQVAMYLGIRKKPSPGRSDLPGI